MEKKLNRLENQEAKDQILKAITSHSIATWGHFNFLGEYDFSDEKLQDSVGIQPPQIQPNLRESLELKIGQQKGLQKILWCVRTFMQNNPCKEYINFKGYSGENL